MHKEIHAICQYCFPNIGCSNQSFKICENLWQIFMISNSFYNRKHNQILKYQNIFLLGVKVTSIISLCITRNNYFNIQKISMAVFWYSSHPLIMPHPPTTTPFIKHDFRCTEIVKCCEISPTPYIRPFFHWGGVAIIREGRLLYCHWDIILVISFLCFI